MYTRLLKAPLRADKSFFLFGPRGTGKTFWVKNQFPNALYLDLLSTSLYRDLLSNPSSLEEMIRPGFADFIILDEVQKIPELLNEVHRLIENFHYKFILTGSSARSLRRRGVNLLAGRAFTFHLYTLTPEELGPDFNLDFCLKYGSLPALFSEKDPNLYLETYVKTYLREEVLQEGLVRNLSTFSHFLQVASFSQASILNISEIARESAINRKVCESYFDILEDLLLAKRISLFTKRASRQVSGHPKFYFFDTGVFRTLRPKGPFDKPEEIDGAALETLFFQQAQAYIDYYELGLEIYYWRTRSQLEVDFILYGARGIFAFEIKRAKNLSPKDLRALEAFHEEYPEAKCFLLYGGDRPRYFGSIQAIPFVEALKTLPKLLQ